MKIKKGDNIKVTRGKDKGREGTVEKAYTAREMVVIPGINEYKRHIKRNVTGQKSEIVTITKPLPVSVIALICPHCKKQTRVGYKEEKGRKFRVCRKCGKGI